MGGIMGLKEEIGAIDCSIVGIIALNFSSSVGVVFLNKWLFQYEEFAFSYTLVLLHMLFVTICLLACVAFGIFKPKRIPLQGAVPLSLSFCGFVVLTNASLQFNSVGFY